MKAACQQAFDAMDAHGNIGGRQPSNLSDFGSVQIFEIADDDLAVERLELLDQGSEAIEVPAFADTSWLVGHLFQLLQANQGTKYEALLKDMRSANVVSDSIDPRT